MEPKSLQALRAKLAAYDCSNYKWRDYLSYEENRGVFLADRVEQELGFYTEMRLVEYNPNPGAEHLPVGGRVDWIDQMHCTEQKQNPSSDNGSSKKQNIRKVKEYAEEHDLIPLYCYVQDRPKNKYMKDGVLHLHGSAIFEYFGCPESYTDFTADVKEVTILIRKLMVEKFDSFYGESA